MRKPHTYLQADVPIYAQMYIENVWKDIRRILNQSALGAGNRGLGKSEEFNFSLHTYPSMQFYFFNCGYLLTLLTISHQSIAVKNIIFGFFFGCSGFFLHLSQLLTCRTLMKDSCLCHCKRGEISSVSFLLFYIYPLREHCQHRVSSSPSVI